MPRLVCGERELALQPGQSVLDALLDAGVEVASSCRAGACQSCLVQVTHGAVPPRAQVGLKETLRSRGYVLACQAVPESDLTVSVATAALELPARVEAVEYLAKDVLRVRLRPETELVYRAGQFLTLARADGLSRAYSLASSPAGGPLLELHVRVLTGGRMSSWLASPEAVGAAVRIRGPAGDCFYTSESAEQPLVLAGAGTGLAPLWGILRDAIGAGHRGAIQLWHGARDADGLYLRAELSQLAREHSHFTYHPCALDAPVGGELGRGRLDELLLAATSSFAQPRFFLCGDAALVQGLKRALFLRGAPLREIYADAFLGAAGA